MRHLVFAPRPGLRLDEQLALELEGPLGRRPGPAEIQVLLAQGSVFRAKRRWRDPGVPGGPEPVEVFWPDLPVTEFTLDPARVVWEDEWFWLVDKPAGVNAAPSPFSDRDCLTWGLQKLSGGQAEVSAVHRLDRDTSGLMLFAKSKPAERALHTLFRERRLRKVYAAATPVLPPGDPRVLGGRWVWREPVAFRGPPRDAATTTVAGGLDGQGRQLWTVFPHTGRTHQIRQHFARHLVPLWGDRVYAPGVYGREVPLALDCWAYRFTHPFRGVRLTLTRPGKTGHTYGNLTPPSSSG